MLALCLFEKSYCDLDLGDCHDPKVKFVSREVIGDELVQNTFTIDIRTGSKLCFKKLDSTKNFNRDTPKTYGDSQLNVHTQDSINVKQPLPKNKNLDIPKLYNASHDAEILDSTKMYKESHHVGNLDSTKKQSRVFQIPHNDISDQNNLAIDKTIKNRKVNTISHIEDEIFKISIDSIRYEYPQEVVYKFVNPKIEYQCQCLCDFLASVSVCQICIWT